MKKVSESQKKASKKWDDAHKERKKYIVAKSHAKSFIKNLATPEDLIELTKLIEKKQK